MNGFVSLEFGGKVRDFKFSLWVIGELIEETGKQLSELDQALQNNPFKYWPMVMYYSACYAAMKAKEPVDFELLDACEWFNDAGGIQSEVVAKFQVAFYKSLSKDTPKAEGQDEEKKSE